MVSVCFCRFCLYQFVCSCFFEGGVVMVHAGHLGLCYEQVMHELASPMYVSFFKQSTC